MESNFEKDPRANVSPEEAAQAIAAITADQSTIRTEAKPPKWYYPGFSLCMGALVAISGILPSGSLTLIILLLVIVLLEGIMLGTYLRVRKVKTKVSTSDLILGASLGVVTIAVLWIVQMPSVQTVFPWWADVCVGAAVALLWYIITRFADRTRVER